MLVLIVEVMLAVAIVGSSSNGNVMCLLGDE